MEKAIFGFDLFGKWRSRGAGVGNLCQKLHSDGSFLNV
jgi:hypothetical protein